MRRRHHSTRNWRLYLVLAAACGVAATALHFLFAVPDQVEQYTERKIDEAVRDAVKDEVRQAAPR